jgi:regulatory protein
MPSTPPPAGPAPTEASLHEAALSYLTRYSATAATLTRVLTARVLRWARASGASGEERAAPLQAVPAVVGRLVASGIVDDAAFAESRARRLHRAGRSRRAIAAHLQERGVPAVLAAQPEDPDAELAAALLYLGRRRLGPFRRIPDPATRPQDLARLARAGFPAVIATAALDLSHEAAEALLIQARQN